MTLLKNSPLWKMKVNNKWQKFVHSDVRQSTTKKIIATIFSIFFAFVIAIIIACSVCGTWGNIGEVLSTIFVSGYKPAFINTLISNMSILIVGGLAFIFTYKAGLFNIGISGQMIAGGTAATIICHLGHLAPGVNQFVIIIASMATGAIFASLVGALKAFLRVNEVVSSIMLNWILYFMSILILGSLPIPHDSSNLNTLAPNDNLLLRMNGNFAWPLLIIALISIIIVFVILNFTVLGKKQKVTGLSNTGALAAGYNVKANMIISMAISGAISGLLAVMIYCGFSPNMPVTAAAKAIPQDGFNGISVGLISMVNPVATVPVSLFFSMVKTTTSNLQMLGIDNHIADVLFGIVVYGAAAITLFLNVKPYWLTLKIFRGKNYSIIQHERNMTNIQLLSLSSDQCAVLHKYFVYYQKQQYAPSAMKLNWIIKIKMLVGNMRYHVVKHEAKIKVWKSQRIDCLTGKKFYRQEMIGISTKKKHLIAKTNGVNKWYIKVNDQVLADPEFANNIKLITGIVPGKDFIAQVNKINEQFKLEPFSDLNVRCVAKLSYLQNLRTGLIYRGVIAKQNKLTYFTLTQTKEQAEAIGLAEIRSKKQLNFARSAYFKAYQKTYELVKAHYDTMAKTFTRDKQLNMMGIRFDSVALEKIYMNNLKHEIAAISHLINCPLTKSQLVEVEALVSKAQYLQQRIDTANSQVGSFRRMAQPHFEKAEKLAEKARKIHSQLKSDSRVINKLLDCQLKDVEVNMIHQLATKMISLNNEVEKIRSSSDEVKAIAETYIMRSKDASDSATTDTIALKQVQKKMESIVERARLTAKETEHDKWSSQIIANEEAEKELKKLALKHARKVSRRGDYDEEY